MDSWLTELRQQRAIAVVRSPSLERGRWMAQAAIAAGMRFIEITLNSAGALPLVAELRMRFPQCWIGVGTVLAVSDLKEALMAGAQFGFSPVVALELLDLAQAHEFPMVLGGATPTEIFQAWRAGATAVKVFPVTCLGGSQYIHCLQDPLAGIPLIPTGGVTVDNAVSFLEAGAIAVGLSTGLFPKQMAQTDERSTQALIQARVDQLQENFLRAGLAPLSPPSYARIEPQNLPYPYGPIR